MPLRTPAPVSNVQRQRQFRARNPGYRNRYRTPNETPAQREAMIAAMAADATETAAPHTVMSASSAAPSTAMVWHASA
jgi:hypothetical protein